jgi:hypothetical protein
MIESLQIGSTVSPWNAHPITMEMFTHDKGQFPINNLQTHVIFQMSLIDTESLKAL